MNESLVFVYLKLMSYFLYLIDHTPLSIAVCDDQMLRLQGIDRNLS